MKVCISTGPRSFHLKYLLPGFNSYNIDVKFIIGLNLDFLYRMLSKYMPSNIAFRVNSMSIPCDNVVTCLFGELFARLSTYLGRFNSINFLSKFCNYISHYLFAAKAFIVLSQNKTDIFHCRSSFALYNFFGPKKFIKLCDHSIANPLIISQLIYHRGDLNKSKEISYKYLKPHEKLAFHDLKNSDHIVVNSDFVKETLVRSSFPSNKITVIELSISYETLSLAKSFDNQHNLLPVNNLLFAGSWIQRKGIDVLIHSLSLIPESISLNVAGTSNNTFKGLPTKDRVNGLGYLNRLELLSLMARSPIFVFPTYCEGFAKTIQEALASGCYIITTTNSGFSVSHGFHASLIKPGCEKQLANALIKAVNDPQIHEKGLANKKLARKVYDPILYPQRMASLYSTLISSSKFVK